MSFFSYYKFDILKASVESPISVIVYFDDYLLIATGRHLLFRCINGGSVVSKKRNKKWAELVKNFMADKV